MRAIDIGLIKERQDNVLIKILYIKYLVQWYSNAFGIRLRVFFFFILFAFNFIDFFFSYFSVAVCFLAREYWIN